MTSPKSYDQKSDFITEVQSAFKRGDGDSFVFSTSLFQLQLPAHRAFHFLFPWVCSSSGRGYVSAQGQVGDAGTKKWFSASAPASWLLSIHFLGVDIADHCTGVQARAGFFWWYGSSQSSCIRKVFFYYFPKAREEKEPGSPLVRGAGIGWAEDTWALSDASCILFGCICDAYACVLFCIVFLYTSSLEGCHYAQYLTKSMNHYFIFWNPKMLKCFHGKQNIFKNCLIEFTKINLLSLSVDFQQDGCLCSFVFFPFNYCVAGKGIVSPRPSDFKPWL